MCGASSDIACDCMRAPYVKRFVAEQSVVGSGMVEAASAGRGNRKAKAPLECDCEFVVSKLGSSAVNCVAEPLTITNAGGTADASRVCIGGCEEKVSQEVFMISAKQ